MKSPAKTPAKKRVSKSKNVVIVESPAKAKTIEAFLGKDFVVRASYGHVRDLPKSRLGIDVDNDFAPKYMVLTDKKPVVKTLKSLADVAPTIYLATDPDREGEAIAWHIKEALAQKDTSRFKRIVFSEITKKSVKNSLDYARDIDYNVVDAQQARRVLDRLIGYSLSPILGRKIQRGLSAGRVQSICVKLLCERDQAIADFKPEEYWVITVRFNLDNNRVLACQLIAKDNPKTKLAIKTESEARAIESDLNQTKYCIDAITTRPVSRQPKPPFITSSLQQESSRWFGWSPKKTMAVAQQLYEGIAIGSETVGLITYMRTDSIRIADEALISVRDYIQTTYGPDYLPKQSRAFKTKGKQSIQDAHEAIRPSYVTQVPKQIETYLSSDQNKLYGLIWHRFVASQMTACQLESTQILVKTDPDPVYYLKATGSRIIFDGFKKIYEEKTEGDAESDEAQLPKLESGQALQKKSVEPVQKFTQPPPYFTEASLIKTLEQEGIGRPSTYAPTMSTIQDRGYAEKTGKQLRSTELGQLVNKQLALFFDDVLNVKFTANLETQLDEIMSGKHAWHAIVRSFYDPFSKQVTIADEKMAKINRDKPTDLVCDNCQSPMVIKTGRYGEFTACSNYPDCKNILKTPKVQVQTGVTCPMCATETTQNPIVERKTRRGKLFFGCSGYPDCKYALWDRPLNKPCPNCQNPITVEKVKKTETVRYCPACETAV